MTDTCIPFPVQDHQCKSFGLGKATFTALSHDCFTGWKFGKEGPATSSGLHLEKFQGGEERERGRGKGGNSKESGIKKGDGLD